MASTWFWLAPGNTKEARHDPARQTNNPGGQLSTNGQIKTNGNPVVPFLGKGLSSSPPTIQLSTLAITTIAASWLAKPRPWPFWA